MQQVRNAANLLDRPVNQGTRVRRRIPLERRRFPLLLEKNPVDNHLGRGKLLTQAVMQFARNATPLVILHRDQAA